MNLFDSARRTHNNTNSTFVFFVTVVKLDQKTKRQVNKRNQKMVGVSQNTAHAKTRQTKSKNLGEQTEWTNSVEANRKCMMLQHGKQILEWEQILRCLIEITNKSKIQTQGKKSENRAGNRMRENEASLKSSMLSYMILQEDEVDLPRNSEKEPTINLTSIWKVRMEREVNSSNFNAEIRHISDKSSCWSVH